MMKCKYCDQALANNDEATEHASDCPVMNGEPTADAQKLDNLLVKYAGLVRQNAELKENLASVVDERDALRAKLQFHLDKAHELEGHLNRLTGQIEMLQVLKGAL